ncbi:DUF4250 domain-containing protein [Pseudaeromonas pectinilytica]
MFSLTRFATLPAPMLLSLVNTQLRDHFPSLEELVRYHDIDAAELSAYLATANFHYIAEQNQFKSG